eukprot:CAMPEP_0204832916 /NCGR_PEP_ID=MMETSP1346-20131115/15106_1 /ASSEMBLY_ACC=CAM_ASM_000771 /TAXON_ID=215587 /ORGANISM="Aplanochytrium stocchinoi, Strain GSBS06" /LENGTH=398 /DNA_ID=CAMNT_0051965033 /DNA_START=304 /DNA_END=1500 /DNA_ORIENTATION=-
METPEKSKKKSPLDLSDDDNDTLDQETIVKSVGYKASPFHKQARDLLSSLGLKNLSPALNQAKITKDEVVKQLKVVVKTQAVEDLSLRKATLFLEEHFDQTLDPKEFKHLIRKKLSELVAEKLAGRLDNESESELEQEKENSVETQKPTPRKEKDKQPEKRSFSKVKKETVKPAKDSASTSSTSGQKKGSAHVDATEPLDTRSDKDNGIPISFSNSMARHQLNTFLIELHNPNKSEESKSINLSGDTGAVGRVSVIDAEGVRFTDSPTKMKSQKKKDLLYKSRYKKGSALRIDFKGDVYEGILTNSSVSACVVSVTSKEAEVRNVYNRFIQATFQKNIMQNMHGEMVKGDVDVSKFKHSRDVDVNKYDAFEKGDKKVGAKKRKGAASSSSRSTKKSKT